MRVRWVVADEDRHEVDRDAIKRVLAGAADVQLEGRVVPVVRSRAAGISRCAGLADKVRMWSRVTSTRAEPLLECLARLAESEPAKVAAAALAWISVEPNAVVGGCAREDEAVCPSPTDKSSAPKDQPAEYELF